MIVWIVKIKLCIRLIYSKSNHQHVLIGAYKNYYLLCLLWHEVNMKKLIDILLITLNFYTLHTDPPFKILDQPLPNNNDDAVLNENFRG